MIRDDIKAATITAMKAKEKERTAALRQISAKLKDRDIEERTSGKDIAAFCKKWPNSAANRSRCMKKAGAKNSPLPRPLSWP